MTRAESLRPLAVLVAFLAAFMAPTVQAAKAVALVTQLDGSVFFLVESGQRPVKSFVKLLEGDVLALDKAARLQIVYFDGGRQETWAGSGRLEIAQTESKPSGLSAPQIKKLPAILVKQIARTPALDKHARSGAARLRTVASAEAIARVEQTYAKWRAQTAPDDLTPEFYRLTEFFNMSEIDRVERILAELQQEQPLDAQVMLLVSLYREAILRLPK